MASGRIPNVLAAGRVHVDLWVAGQQIWLGPAMTGRTVRLWASLDRVHVLLDGHRIKILPSRLDGSDPGPSRCRRRHTRRATAPAAGITEVP